MGRGEEEGEGDWVAWELAVLHPLRTGVALALPVPVLLTDTEREEEGLPLPERA